MTKDNPAEKSGAERRKAKRRSILDTFSLFAVVPKKGIHRLKIHDVSDLGIRFDLDVEGESPADFPLNTEETLNLRFYLNQSLYLPLDVKVIRIEGETAQRRVAGEITDQNSKSYKAFLAFLGMLDEVIDIALIERA